MMKVSMSLLLGATMVASSILAAAPQKSVPLAFAIINGDRVLENSNIGRQAREQIEAGAAVWQERVGVLSTALETLTRQRQEQALTINDAALARMNREIEEKSVELDRLNDDARRELARLEQQVTLDVNVQLGPLVDRFAADRRFDLILDSARMQGMLYFDPSHDLTEDFLAMVNSSAPVGSR